MSSLWKIPRQMAKALWPFGSIFPEREGRWKSCCPMCFHDPDWDQRGVIHQRAFIEAPEPEEVPTSPGSAARTPKHKRQKTTRAADPPPPVDLTPYEDKTFAQRFKNLAEIICSHIRNRTVPSIVAEDKTYKKANMTKTFKSFTIRFMAYCCYTYAKGPDPSIENDATTLAAMKKKNPDLFKVAKEFLDFLCYLNRFLVLDAHRKDFILVIKEEDIMRANIKGFLDEQVKRIQKGGFSLVWLKERIVANKMRKIEHVQGMYYPNALLLAIMCERIRKEIPFTKLRAKHMGNFLITDAEAKLLQEHPVFYTPMGGDSDDDFVAPAESSTDDEFNA